MPKQTRKSAAPKRANLVLTNAVEEVKSSEEVNNSKKILLPVLVVLALLAMLYYFRGLFAVSLVNNQPIWRLSVVKQLEKQDGKRVVDTLITEKLILQEASRLKLTVSQAEIDQEMEKISAQLQQQGQELEQALEAQGASKDELTYQIRLQKLVEKMLADKVNVNEEDIEVYLAANKEMIPTATSAAEKASQREEVREQLRQEKLGEAFSTWMEDLRSKAKIITLKQY